MSQSTTSELGQVPSLPKKTIIRKEDHTNSCNLERRTNNQTYFEWDVSTRYQKLVSTSSLSFKYPSRVWILVHSLFLLPTSISVIRFICKWTSNTFYKIKKNEIYSSMYRLQNPRVGPNEINNDNLMYYLWKVRE